MVGLAGNSARPASHGVWKSYATDSLKRNLLQCQPDHGVWIFLDARTGVQLPEEYCVKCDTANYKHFAVQASADNEDTLETSSSFSWRSDGNVVLSSKPPFHESGCAHGMLAWRAHEFHLSRRCVRHPRVLTVLLQ